MSKRPEKIIYQASHKTHRELIREWAEKFTWFDKRQMLLAMHGEATKRHRRMEIDLFRMVKTKELRCTQYGRKLIYALPGKTRNFNEFQGANLYHELSCTEAAVRFSMSDYNSDLLPESAFRGCGVVPDGGMIGEDLLLWEFSTKHNVFYSNNLIGKLRAYQKKLSEIEKKFGAKATVVFILDVPGDTVRRFVGSLGRDVGSLGGSTPPRYNGTDFRTLLLPFCYFIDYKTFLDIPLGEALTAPVYIFSDGKEYSLA